jgi:2'-5' RNA ligase
MSTLRLFVAVDPAPEVRDRLRDAIGRSRPRAPSAKWVDAASLHVTLAFLGDVEEARVAEHSAAIAAVASRHAPIDLSFRGAGAFGGRKPRVLWVGVEGAVEALAAAQRDLSTALVPLGYAPENRPFSAHLTLARARDPRGDAALAACAEALAGEDFGATRVASILLYRSELSSKGAKYTLLSEAPLGP